MGRALLTDVAHALVRAVSRLVSTPWFPSVAKRGGAARRSACATWRQACLLLVLCAAAAYAQQRQMTVAQLVSFIRSSIQLHQDDRQVADVVHRVKLANHLDEKTIEELEGMGAGPRTVVALKQLGIATASLAPPPPPAPKATVVLLPAPDLLEQKRVLAEVTEAAQSYVQSLPNFICTQVTRRHIDPTRTETWKSDGVIQEQLSYVDHHEDYKVVMVNDRLVTGLTHDKIGGNRSSGEFGSMLEDIFDSSSNAKFEWQRWATLRGRRMHVFSFTILKPYSRYSIRDDTSGQTIVPGYHGLIYADRDTLKVMRITMECDDIPASFAVHEASEILDYDFVTISGEKFLLPLKADLRFRGDRALVWNEIEFRLYRKFSTDAVITFDAPDAIPADQLEEQPAR